MYKFYVFMDGQVFGPYTTAQMLSFPLLPDTQVTEASLNGQWYRADQFRFNDWLQREQASIAQPQQYPQQNLQQPSMSQGNSVNYPAAIHSSGSGQNSAQSVNINISNPNQYGQSNVPIGQNVVEPRNLYKWNWGPFSFGWIWGVFNGTYWLLFCILFAFIPIVGQIANFVIACVAGAKGNRWAWENKQWRDVEHFERVQHSWNTWGLVAFLLSILILIIGVAVALAYSADSVSSSIYQPCTPVYNYDFEY